MSNTQHTVQQWHAPFTASGDAAKHPLSLMKALGNASGGFYPIGKNGLLHAGVHFDQETANHLNQHEVQAIADGEVVAWRQDTQEAITLFEAQKKTFSRNFVLLRHKLQAPAIDGAGAPPELTFYSLYMHLKSWKSCQTDKNPLPRWQSRSSYQVKPDDSVLGLRVRAKPRGGQTPTLGLLPRGCEVELQPLQDGETTNGWRRLKQITNGQMLPTPLPEGTEGWLFAGELDQVQGNTNTYRVGTKAKDKEDALLGGKGLNLRATNNTNNIIGQIPKGVRFTLGEAVDNYRPITGFETGDDQPRLPRSYLEGSVHKDYVNVLDPQPLALDTIHVPKQPIPIQAGELIGYVGQNQNLNDSTSQPLMHLEVFTQDNLPSFIEQSRSWAEKEGFSESHKTLLKIQQGDSQVFPYTGLDRLPNATQAKPATASLLLNRQQLDRLPSTHRRWDSDSSARWWLLENCLPANTDDETPTHYWIHETLSKLQPLTPWHWVGYTCLDEQRRPLEHLLSQLYHHRETPLTQLQHLLQSNSWLGATLSNAQRMLPVGLGVNTLRKLFEHSHQLKHYLPRLNSVEPGDLQQHLLGLLDKNKDRWLSPEEIGQAQQKPWLQQRLASLAIKTHSEWHWNANKWKALDGLANHTCNSPNPQWAAQKELIEQLCWWKDVAAETELKADGLIWTLHPGHLVSQLQKSSVFRFTREMLIASVPDTGWQLNDQDTEKLLNALNEYAGKYEVNTPLRAAHFLAQVAHESENFTRLTENINYTASRDDVQEKLRDAPSEIRDSIIIEGERFARQPNFFNYVYRGEATTLGNGGYNSGDGFKYRGRGYIQLTGRYNYGRVNRYYLSFNGVDLGLLENPDQMNSKVDLSVEISFVYWRFMGANGDSNLHADGGSDDITIHKVGANINGWKPSASAPIPDLPNGHRDRLKRFKSVFSLLGL